MRLVLKVPPDASLMSSMLYEGVAYLLSRVGGKVTPECVELPDDAFVQAFRTIAKEGDKVIDRLRIITALNDRKSLENLLKHLGVKAEDFWPEKKGGGKASIVPYGHLIAKVGEVAIKNPDALKRSGVVELRVRLKGKEVIIGSQAPFLSLALFKSCDKYGSLGVWEFTSLGEQVPQKLSVNAALLCLLGLHSSYVRKVGNTNVFLLLDPSEVTEVLNASAVMGEDPSEAMRWRINARDVGKEIIAEFPEASVVPSAVMARLALSIKLTDSLRMTNIDVLRLRLVRVDEEGKIYKVYGDTPVEVRKHPLLRGELCGELSKHVDASSPLMRCVRRFVLKSLLGRAGVRLCEESDHVLRAVDALYRFVALEDPVALAEYVRHLMDAAGVLEATGGEGDAGWRMRTYRRWVAGLDHALRQLGVGPH